MTSFDDRVLKRIASIVMNERCKRGWTQKEFARKTGLGANAVCYLERGIPTSDKSVYKALNALGLDVDSILKND